MSPLLCLLLGHAAADSAAAPVPDSSVAGAAVVVPAVLEEARPQPVLASPVEPPPVVAPASVPSAAPAVSRRTTADRFGSWQVGLAAGGAAGYGFSFRRWFGDGNALQVNLAPYVSRTNYPGSEDPNDENRLLDSGFVLEASLVAGISWLHQIVQVPLFSDAGELKVLSYVAGSTDLSVEQQQMDRWSYKADGVSTQRWYDDYYRTRREFRLGGGGGCELSRWRLSTNLMVGLAGWYEDVSGDFGIQPDAQWGVHFRF
jgi:hypothetical protein